MAVVWENAEPVSEGGKYETVEAVSYMLRRRFTWLKPGVNGILPCMPLNVLNMTRAVKIHTPNR